MCVPGPHPEFLVEQYMYCHPDTVVLRRGRPKVLRWQHLIGAQGLVLQVKRSRDSELQIDSLGLYFRHVALEQLDPLATLIRQHHLRVAWLDAWIAFKWITRKGNTQFQVKLSTRDDAKELARLLQQSGCRLDRLEPHLLCTQKALRAAAAETEVDADATLTDDTATQDKFRLLHDSLSQGTTTHASPYASQCYSQPTANSAAFSQTAWRAQLCDASQSQTQLCDASQSQGRIGVVTPSAAASVQSLISENAPRSTVSACTSVSKSTRSQLRALFGAGYCWTGTPSEGLASQRLDVARLIRRRQSLHLALESYAYAQLIRGHRGTREGSKWYHVGLASDLCLSLVPASGAAAQPLIVLTRASSTLAEFVPHPGYLRAYRAQGILGLRQRDAIPNSVRAHVQLHLNDLYLDVACQWLAFWEIAVEDRAEPVLATESTHLNSGWPRPWSSSSRTSGFSHSSRTSRYGSRCLRRLN